MRIIQLLMIMLAATLAGTATVKTICGEGAVIGQSYELTCEINGNIVSGINWYKSGESQPIITCNLVSTCVSAEASLYTPTHVVNNEQKFAILKVTEDDLTRTWTCVDGISPSSSGFSQCTIPKKPAETTVICNTDGLNVGKPLLLICNIKGTVIHGINWFRDGKMISTNTTYLSNDSRQRLIILDVTKDDMHKTWSCVDGTALPNNIPLGCTLEPESMSVDANPNTTEARRESVDFSVIVAVLIVIIDVVLYLVCKDYLSEVKKIYIIYCVVDIVIVGVIVGIASYYIYLRTSNIGIIAGLCVGFLVVSTVIKLIIVKTKLFSKCSSNGSSDIRENHPM